MIARLAASALLLAAALGGSGAAAQEVRIERVSFQAPAAGFAAAVPAGSALAGSPSLALGAQGLLAPSLAFSPAAAPSISAPGAIPAPAPAANPAPAAGEAVLSPRTAALESAAERRDAPPARAVPSVQTPARAAFGGSFLAAPSLEPLAAADGGPRSSETDRDGAERDFSALLGERLAAGTGVAPEPAAAAASSGRVPSRLAPPSRSRARLLAVVPALLAAGLHPGLHGILHPSLATWHVLSEGGYVAGNVGAAIFPLVQIYQTFHGKSTPRSRAIVGAAASLALGLISAPILHKTLWGMQNVFGGLTLLVPLFLGSIAGRVRGGGLKETALIAAGALVASAAAYFAAAAALPGLLAAAFSAAAISKIALAVQFATSAMFLWMFLPDVVKVMRGKAAGGFSPGFNLMFFLSAAGSMVWAVPSAWIYSGADQDTYRLIFSVNAIYALASFVSYWFSKREAKG